ncbi:MAG TPA: double-strand break repair helicase AddA, partial [Tardiphaga sp.]
MSGPRNIPEAARAKQALASDPGASVFVSANAGSGKTYVLVNRVIRLLLDGVPPEKILCVTFTKAAAANMAERVFSKLGHWVSLDDTALDAEIRNAGVGKLDSRMRMRARELFACALETPGGLKVQTIHALCTRLLQQFPFEANVPARFSVLDDRDQNEMMERASLAVLLQAAAAPDSAEGRALAIAMTSAADVTFRDVVREASLSRDQFLAWIARAGSTDAAMAQLSAALGVQPDDSTEAVEQDIVDGPHLPRRRWKDAAGILAGGTKTDNDQAARLRAALDFHGSAQVDEYLRVFFTAGMEPRKALATKKINDGHPNLAATLKNEGERLSGLLARRRAVAMRERTQALLVIAGNVAENYRREKNERGLLDYDDLIDKTLAMLDNVSSAWVHFKLDRGVDHVLIDEAQDTSPRQWDIVTHLISEFTTGEGARDGVKRTVFAVGDEKQSIFSFQGAVPREFADRRQYFKTRFEAAGLKFDPVAFTYSFRSGAAILQSVDHVFRDEAIYRSIHAENAYPIHESLADAGPSLIDLWELQQPDERQDLEGWQAPFDAVSETSPEVKLARRVQTEIRTLIAEGTETGAIGKRRRLRYGDMLVLVRRRGKAFNAIIQALKHAGIPVAGADRLKLTEHIAIIDLMNLADALLLPQDDLALATVLKSPLFGLDDDDLFKLAWERPGSLRAALDHHAAGDGKLNDALKRLAACEQRFAGETPFSFYAWLLGGDGGRAKILRRLGHEANDALDEFLELALGYERKAPASLQGFVAWLRAADTEVKRDMEISRDEVRVMTVHGAKGLEAPVVFLVDTTSSPADSQRLNLIHLPVGNAAPNTPGVVVWAGKKADDPPAVATARAAMIEETEDEYRRLLYVAMTRAADRLIVGGCMPGNRNEVRPLSWYDLICKGLENSGLHMQTVPPPDGVVKRYSRLEDAMPPPGTAATAAVAAPIALPAWLRAQ